MRGRSRQSKRKRNSPRSLASVQPWMYSQADSGRGRRYARGSRIRSRLQQAKVGSIPCFFVSARKSREPCQSRRPIEIDGVLRLHAFKERPNLTHSVHRLMFNGRRRQAARMRTRDDLRMRGKRSARHLVGGAPDLSVRPDSRHPGRLGFELVTQERLASAHASAPGPANAPIADASVRRKVVQAAIGA
jgi:hypothetical protein